MVMELVAGTDAGVLLRRRGRLPHRQAVCLVAQVCDGLQHAHDHDVVHRDVSPRNILVAPDGATAKLADFGLAGSPRDLERAGGADSMGTPGYVAPEVVAGASPSRASDLYALGVVAHRLLAGSTRGRPADPDATTPLATAALPVPALADAPADVPGGVLAAVRRALEHDPDARPSSAAAFRAALLGGQRSALPVAA
jgi:serine/threonine-protein kinase